MPPRILRFAEYPVVPWKNGGGTTRVIASEPGVAEPGWRLSIATIDRDGDFSDFAGFDRTIVPIEGAGVDLSFDGGSAVRLDTLYEPLRFAGESHVACRLIDGPVRDLNVMTLRARFDHRLAVRAARDVLEIDTATGFGFAVVLAGALDAGGDVAYAGDTLCWAAGDARTSLLTLRARDGGKAVACVVDVLPRSTPAVPQP